MALFRHPWVIHISVAVFLVSVTIAIFGRSLSYGYISLDDPAYILQNIETQRGLTQSGLDWAFSTVHTGYPQPLTWVSHMLDNELFGIDPHFAHLENLLIHGTNACLLYLLLVAATTSWRRSALVALLFAIHPLRVESVVWIAERKDVLWAFFGLLCLFSYVRYSLKRSRLLYFLSLLSFMLAIASKPIAVLVPLAMVALDIWPLGTLRLPSSRSEIRSSLLTVLSSIAAKWPFFVLSLSAGAFTIYTTSAANITYSAERMGLTERFYLAGAGILEVLRKLFVPTNLSLFYPLPSDYPKLLTFLSWTLILGLTFGICWCGCRKKKRYLIAGWFWFLWMILPVSGLLQAGHHSAADRYTYFPTIGLLIAIVWATVDLIQLRNRFVKAAGIIAAIYVTFLSALTIGYVEKWRSDYDLWGDSLKINAHNYFALAHLSKLAADGGDASAAAYFSARAVDEFPEIDEARVNLANNLAGSGDSARAEEIVREILNRRPFHADANLIKGLLAGPNDPSAVAQFLRALQGALQNPTAAIYVSMFYSRSGDPAKAQKYAMWAISTDPTSTAAMRQLWMTLRQFGQTENAIKDYMTITRTNRNFVVPIFEAVSAEIESGDFETAVPLAEAGIGISNRPQGLQVLFGKALIGSGKVENGLAQMKRGGLSELEILKELLGTAASLLESAEQTAAHGAATFSDVAVSISKDRSILARIYKARADVKTGNFKSAHVNAEVAYKMAQLANLTSLGAEAEEILRSIAAEVD